MVERSYHRARGVVRSTSSFFLVIAGFIALLIVPSAKWSKALDHGHIGIGSIAQADAVSGGISLSCSDGSEEGCSGSGGGGDADSGGSS